VYYYAVFNPLTREVIAIDESEHRIEGNDRVEIPSPDPSLVGKIYDPETRSFKDPKPLPLLHLQLDKRTALADGQDSIVVSFAILDAQGNQVDLQGDFKVLLRDAEGRLVKVFLVSLSGGKGTYRLKSTRPGRFAFLPQDFKATRLPEPVFFDFVEPVSQEEIIL